jgi:hypothetical protein
MESVMLHFVLVVAQTNPVEAIKKSKPSATPASDLDGKRDPALCVGEAVSQASQLSRIHVLVQLVLKHKCKSI